MGVKDKCKEFMSHNFGVASAAVVDSMDESEAVTKCRSKISSFLGEQKAIEFDNFIRGV